ncbi:MAG: CHC2 zinc finger domain-containing protein, partial [Candidatus Thermoplasmatota archaeon]
MQNRNKSLFDDYRINIIPILKNSKRPAVRREQYQSELYPRTKLKDWDGNFAAVCGKVSNNLTIVDFDDEKLYIRFFKNVETYTVRTPNGGVHLYFFSKSDVVKTPKFLGYPIDIQGEGSYALCPPSSIEGIKYEVIKDMEILKVDNVFTLLNSYLPKRDERAEDLEEFKSRIDISSIVERYVHPEYHGKGYWQGKCPFHNDTNPSFTVYKDSFYCFGCGKSGDIISFIEFIENVDFKGAVKKLEEFTGIKYFKDRKEPAEKKKGECNYIKDGKFVAKILADEIMNDYKFITTRDNEEIFYYNDGIYHPDAESIIKEEVKSRLGEETTEHRANEVLFQIRASTYIDREEINRHKNLIHLGNGIFDLEKMELIPFSEDIISTVKLPIKYDPKAD